MHPSHRASPQCLSPLNPGVRDWRCARVGAAEEHQGAAGRQVGSLPLVLCCTVLKGPNGSSSPPSNKLPARLPCRITGFFSQPSDVSDLMPPNAPVTLSPDGRRLKFPAFLEDLEVELQVRNLVCSFSSLLPYAH